MKKIMCGAVAMLCTLLTLSTAVSCSNPAGTTIVDRVIIIDPENGNSSEDSGTDIPGGGDNPGGDIPGGGDTPVMPTERIKAVDAIAKIYEYAATDGATPLGLKVYVDNYDQLKDLIDAIRQNLTETHLLDLDISTNRENIIRLDANYFSPVSTKEGASTPVVREGLASLKSIVLTGPSNIDPSAFENCKNLVSAKIQGTLIGDKIFAGCEKLEYVEFLPGTKIIGNDLYYLEELYDGKLHNNILKTIIYPNTIIKLGNIKYVRYHKLERIVLPPRQTSSDFAFANYFDFTNCENLTEVVLPEGMEYLNVYYGSTNKINNVKIPSTIKELKTVNGMSPFYYLPNFKEIFIPKNVEVIDRDVFSQLDKLTRITVDPNNMNYSNIGNHLFNKDGSEMLVYCLGDPATEYTFPSSVNKVGKFVTKESGKQGFILFENGFGNLTTIHVPATIKEFGQIAKDCYGHKDNIKLIFDDRTEELQLTSEAFYGYPRSYGYGDDISECEWLNEIVIPNNVKLSVRNVYNESGEIDRIEPVFKYCYCLTKVTFTGNTIPEKAFSGVKSLETVVLNQVTKIESSAFDECRQLNKIENFKNITEIGSYAFYNCERLDFDANSFKDLKKLGDFAFYNTAIKGCKNLPACLEVIGTGAFAKCKGEFIIDENNKKYKNELHTSNILSKDGKEFIFYGNKAPSITSYTLPNTVETIKSYAFGPQKEVADWMVTDITIPKSVTVIEASSFHSSLGKLKRIVFADNENKWNIQGESVSVSDFDVKDPENNCEKLTYASYDYGTKGYKDCLWEKQAVTPAP